MIQFIADLVLGSSLFIVTFPLIYSGYAYSSLSSTSKTELKLGYEWIAAGLPLLYGFIFASVMAILRTVFGTLLSGGFSWWSMLVWAFAGAICGEIYSLIGHYVLRLPENLYKMKNPNMVHLIAPIFYSLAYGFILYPVSLAILN
ncbi:MAG: hypothetical protein JKX76_01830 [Colwellia sp.]|nr:hypothetical protein [Colwellia sp.]